MSEDYKKILEAQLWNIANTLRGKMDADEFRDYILGFIFYKYLSEKMDIFANEILKQDNIKFRDITAKTEDGKEFIEAIKEEALEKLGYFLKPEELFGEVAERGKGDNEDDVDKFDESKTNFIIEDIQKILINIQLSTMGTDSEEDFDNLFEDMDLNSTKLGKTPEARNAIIAKVLTHLDKIDFKLEHTELDVLGDAYEYLIGKFAGGAGKTAGEFYTPQEVSKVLAKIVTTGKSKLKNVYDPTCGSGSLLLRVAKEVENVSNFYGQEMNRTTYNLARMNMILHGVHYRKFDIKQDDTLEHPQHIDKQFEAIVANPPFSAQWSANPLFTSDDRFSQYGRLAPSGKADFAFVQHMIYHLADNGTMAIVLPHGALFRGGAEQHIRKYLIENKNFLDAVIGLPANIFYGTSIPTCIMVFKKCREKPNDVLFIDASNDFEKNRNQNILTSKDIDKIIETYRNRTEIERYSKAISLDEIKENDYNLNVPRYISTFVEEETIDINIVTENLSSLLNISIENENTISILCNELSVPIPIGFNISLLKLYRQSIIQKIFSQAIRFKNGVEDFPEWVENKIFDVAIKKSSNISANKIEENFGEYIIYGASGILKKVDFYEEENDYISIVKDGAGVGRLLYCKGKSSVLGTLEMIKPQPLVHTYFLFCLLSNIDFVKYVTGSTIPHIYFKDYSNEICQIPCMDEQIKIANFLSAIDKKIDLIQSENIENMLSI
jgi:type I restriction enzyme M protein